MTETSTVVRHRTFVCDRCGNFMTISTENGLPPDRPPDWSQVSMYDYKNTSTAMSVHLCGSCTVEAKSFLFARRSDGSAPAKDKAKNKAR